MLTRAAVAKRLGRSIATVRRLEGAELHPWTDQRGVHRFDPDEVNALAARSPLESPASEEPWSMMPESHFEKENTALLEQLSTLRSDQTAVLRRVVELERESDQLRTTAIEALELVETLMEQSTPHGVRFMLRTLRRARFSF